MLSAPLRVLRFFCGVSEVKHRVTPSPPAGIDLEDEKAEGHADILALRRDRHRRILESQLKKPRAEP